MLRLTAKQFIQEMRLAEATDDCQWELTPGIARGLELVLTIKFDDGYINRYLGPDPFTQVAYAKFMMEVNKAVVDIKENPPRKFKRPKMLSLDAFLEMYQHPGMFAITLDKKTRAYVICVDYNTDYNTDYSTNEGAQNLVDYTHPPCDEVPLNEYVDFMMQLRKLRYDKA